MKYLDIRPNPGFVGRQRELRRLRDIHKRKESAIIVVYGRRRVGKTELIEQFFRDEKILKFEGIQVKAAGRGGHRQDLQRQIDECVRRLGIYREEETVFRNVVCRNWSEFFEILSPLVEEENLVLYFEEIQWLSAYQDNFLAEMKPFWDDRWRHNPRLRIVLCGSSPSFIAGQFLGDKALYNRSEHIFSLAPFDLAEIDQFLGSKGQKETMLAALSVGGVPEYLKQVRDAPSVLLGLCQKSFTRDAFFPGEYQKIFVSSLSDNVHYRKIIEALAGGKFSDRDSLSSRVMNRRRPGGSFSAVIDDLEQCGFISSYSPIHLKNGRNLRRYCLSDEYLYFYQKFILPLKRKIESGQFDERPETALNRQRFNVAMGLAFERWCRKNERIFARILGFDRIEYESGAFFNRAIDKQSPGFQIDLVYLRRDAKIIVAEVKYGEGFSMSKAGRAVREKARLFLEHNPRYAKYTLETVLITSEERPRSPEVDPAFDHIITLNDIFEGARALSRGAMGQ